MDATGYATQILADKGTVKQVYWVACGGSVIDLYPAHCLINATSATVESAIFTGAEFNAFPPAKLGPDSLVVTCSHSGGTPETVEASEIGRSRGAYVLAMTRPAPGSIAASGPAGCMSGRTTRLRRKGLRASRLPLPQR